MSFLFINCLLLIELLLATYWVCLRLYHLLPLFGALALATAYVGKTALRGLKEPAA
jgi:oligosaccharyltransferase complex subunit delta (ribophorin II)